MKTVKTFANLSEAGFASSLLEASGIPALLADEQSYLMTPGLATGGIRLQVEEANFDRAMRVLTEGPDAPAPLANVAGLTVSEERNTPPVGLLVAAFVMLGLLAFAVHQWSEEHRTGPRHRTQTYTEDYNHDGKPDRFATYRDGLLVKTEADRNFDGKIDEWQIMDGEGRPSRVEYDQNYDGKPDIWYYYENGEIRRSEQDTDFNGVPDWFGIYEHGNLVRLDCRPNGSKAVVRRNVYEHGILREEWVDEDQDGKFDYKILHDPFGATSGRIPLQPPH